MKTTQFSFLGKATFCFTLLTGLTGLIAQEEEAAPPPVIRQEGIILASPAADIEFAAPMAIRMTSDANGVQQMFTFSTDSSMSMASGGSSMMNMLQNKSIRNEIDLVDDQYKKIKEFNSKFQKDLQKEIQTLFKPTKGDAKKSNRSANLKGSRLPEVIKEARKKAEEQLKDLLLPHQLKRLEQITHQVQMKNSGTVSALTNGKLREELDLSDDDVKNLKQRAGDIQKKLEEDIEKLRAKAKKELLGELSAKQRKKLEELTGDEFDYKPGFLEETMRHLPRRVRTTPRLNSTLPPATPRVIRKEK